MLPQISCDWVINYDVTCTAPCCAPADCLPGTELLTQGSLLLPSWAAPTELLTQSSLLSLPYLRQPNLTQDQGWIPSSIISQSLNASIQWWWDCSSLPFPGHQSKNRIQNFIVQRRQVETDPFYSSTEAGQTKWSWWHKFSNSLSYLYIVHHSVLFLIHMFCSHI